jgi:hypothetical protein
MKKVSGMSRAEASRASEPYDCTNDPRDALHPLAITSS